MFLRMFQRLRRTQHFLQHLLHLLIARLARPPLTTIRVSSEEIGRKAFESLAELVRNPDSEGEPIPIPGRLVIRKSTAPAPVETTSPPSLPD